MRKIETLKYAWQKANTRGERLGTAQYSDSQDFSRAVCFSSKCQCAGTCGSRQHVTYLVTRKRNGHSKTIDYLQLTRLLPGRRTA